MHDSEWIAGVESIHAELVAMNGLLISPIVDTKYAPLFADIGSGAKAVEIMAATADRMEEIAAKALAVSHRIRSIARSLPIG